MPTEIGEYLTKKGKAYPTLKITGTGPKGNSFPFTMGLNKCRLVLENLDAIRAFVANAPIPVPKEPPAESPSDSDLVL